MKRIKRMFSLLLAIVMVMALGTTAFAANDGSITISNATKDETYAIYKVFDLTYVDVLDDEGNVTSQNVVYTYTKNGDSDALYTALTTDTESPFTLIATDDDNKFNVVLKNGKDAATISDWLTDNKSLLTKTDETTAGSETVQFTGLAYGYYYITSSLGSVVTIDSTTNAVTVIDKNQRPNWDNDKPDDPDNPESSKTSYGKTIENSDVDYDTSTGSYGDTVSYKIGVNAANYVGTEKIIEYYINDTLGTGLSYDKSSVKVVVYGAESDAKELVKDTDYTIKYSEDGQGFLIVIRWYDNEEDTFMYDANSNITVTYNAIIDNDAVIAGSGNLNTAWFDYCKDSNLPEGSDEPGNYNPENPYNKSDEKTTTTYVYALGFHKIDAVTKESLAGAEFTIKQGDTVIGAVKNDDGTYSYTADTTAAGYTTTFVSDTDGLIVVKGLKAAEYTVTETKAPDGYNLLPDSVKITTSNTETSNYTTTYTTYYDADGNVINEKATDGKTVTATYEVNVKELIVENNTGSELPSTGGIGTTIFYVLGGILVVGAVVLLVTKKRMNMNA